MHGSCSEKAVKLLVLMTEVVASVGEDEGYWLSSVYQWIQKLQPGLIARKGQRSQGICNDPQGCPRLTSGKVLPLHFLIGCGIPVDFRQCLRPSVRATLGPGKTTSKSLSPSSCKLRPK